MSVVAIFTADVHLSHKAPVARSAEPDWYEAMARPLKQLRQIQRNHNDPPIFYVGDIFDHWNSPAELINFALEFLPHGFSIYGQHDLPLHSKKDIKKSAYWTLVKTELLDHLSYPYQINRDITVHGFGWNQPIEPNKTKGFNIALVHRYVWSGGASYANAPRENHVDQLFKEAKGYNGVVCGDNHKPFVVHKGKNTIVNCGSLMCRSIDQRNYEPNVWLLYDDMDIRPEPLSVKDDLWIDEVTQETTSEIKLDALVENFRKLSSSTINFLEFLERALNSPKLSTKAKETLRSILDEVHGKN